VTGGDFFTNTATDTGKLVTVSGVGSYVVDTVTSPTVAVMKTAFGETFSAKSFTMTGNSVYPGETGIWAARMLEGWNERCPGKSSMRRIRLVYRTPSIHTLLVEDTSKGYLSVAGNDERRAFLAETQGDTPRIIEGPETMAVVDSTTASKDCVVSWKPVSGAPNIDYTGPVHFVLSHAVDTINGTTLNGYKQKVNAAAMTNFGFEIGTVMYIDFGVKHSFDPETPWIEEDHLLYRAEGWADGVSVAQMKAIVDSYPLQVLVGGAITWKAEASKSTQTIQAPGADKTRTGLNMTRGTADFSGFDNLLGWL
jgi:hypothetical protein